MEWSELAIGLTAILLGLYYWSTSTFDFWRSRGVIGPAPLPFLGNLAPIFFVKRSFGEFFKDIYDANRDLGVIGIFMRRQPALVLRDPDLIKDVLIKDFSIFADRGHNTFEKAEPLTHHLVNLKPARWRPLRNKLSPVFTSGKLKKMFYLLLQCGAHFEEHLERLVARGEPIECRELTAKFGTDVIGLCAFGLQTNSLADEDSEFRKMGRRILRTDWRKMVKLRLREYAPWLYTMLGSAVVDWTLTNFFVNLMRDTIEYRKRNNVVKHDFIDLLMDLRDNPCKIGDMELTDNLLTAQLFVFFLAGFETSSTTMSNALYELAQNQSIQDRLRDEINSHLATTNGELTYDGIKSMKYLQMVMQETLRIYPAVTVLLRMSMEPYTFAGTKLSIPSGTQIVIPLLGIHRDSRIYPKPDVFDPERFTEEAIAARHSMSWLAFGDGPRNCIGARFANYQTKVGLIKVLQRYKVEVCDETQIPYVINSRSFLLTPQNGIYLKFSKVV